MANNAKYFQYSFGKKATVIIDCFKAFIEKPSNLLARAQSYSNYKSHNTIKVLIGISPQSTITFVSQAWEGRTSDKLLTENCGLLINLKPGYLVMAYRGFTIHESGWFHQAELSIPAFTKGKDQLDPIDLEKTRGIAKMLESMLNLSLEYYAKSILFFQGTLPINFLSSNGSKCPMIDRIVRVCSALTNLYPPIIPFD